MNNRKTTITLTIAAFLLIASAFASAEDGVNQITGNGYSSPDAHPRFPDFQLTFGTDDGFTGLGFPGSGDDWRFSKRTTPPADSVWIQDWANNFFVNPDFTSSHFGHYDNSRFNRINNFPAGRRFHSNFGNAYGYWRNGNMGNHRGSNEIPEPATIALLSIGCLAFLRKHRP